MTASSVVAILNSNNEIVDMLRFAIEQAGLVAVSAPLDAIRRGAHSVRDLVEEHDPQVILYDLAPPYDRSWRFLDHIRSSPSMRSRTYVFTSTNARRAREITGDAAQVYEIVGKPHDIQEIVGVVLRALGRSDDLPPNARRV